MSAPLEFFATFRRKLEERKIAYVITSGMACMEYGVQQFTKDSDWIVPADYLEPLLKLLFDAERETPPWRISYRAIFGAPLEARFLRHGWTSHIAVWDSGISPEHHLDFFAKPPRVRRVIETGWASRDTLARMKKTDRPKDWPILDALARQAAARDDWSAALHLQSLDVLRSLWERIPDAAKPELSQARPLLGSIGALSDEKLERLLALETSLWQMVNKARYAVYQREWKEFYRRWRKDEEWAWPNQHPFWQQHGQLTKAAARYELPEDPWKKTGVEEVFREGVERARRIMHIGESELTLVLPPMDQMIP